MITINHHLFNFRFNGEQGFNPARGDVFAARIYDNIFFAAGNRDIAILIDATEISDADLRAFVHQRMLDFQDKAPTTASSAANTILDGVRADRWRILVGEDAQALDRMVRESPEEAYEVDFLEKLLADGHLGDLVPQD